MKLDLTLIICMAILTVVISGGCKQRSASVQTVSKHKLFRMMQQTPHGRLYTCRYIGSEKGYHYFECELNPIMPEAKGPQKYRIREAGTYLKDKFALGTNSYEITPEFITLARHRQMAGGEK